MPALAVLLEHGREARELHGGPREAEAWGGGCGDEQLWMGGLVSEWVSGLVIELVSGCEARESLLQQYQSPYPSKS